VDKESKDRKIDDLRTIVEKVEQKAHVPPNNPDIVALRHIVENKISELESEEHSNHGPSGTLESSKTASIDSEIAQLKQAHALLSGDGAKKTVPPATPKKHKMSTAARKRIGNAQRKRWAKQKAGASK
jgi:hypothetical protein